MDKYTSPIYLNGKLVHGAESTFNYETPKEEGNYNIPTRYPRRSVLDMLLGDLFSGNTKSAKNTREYRYLQNIAGKDVIPMNTDDITGSFSQILGMYNKYAEKWGEDDAFEFVENLLLTEKEENYYRLNAFPIQMPSDRKIVWSKEEEEERDTLDKSRMRYLDALLESGRHDEFAVEMYVKPRIQADGRKYWHNDKGRELYYAQEGYSRVHAENEAQKAKESKESGNWAFFEYKIDPILAQKIKMVDRRMKEAKANFDKDVHQLIARDSGALYKNKIARFDSEGFEVFKNENGFDERRAIKSKEQKEKEFAQKLHYNEAMRKAGICKPTKNEKGETIKGNNEGFEMLPDYSLGERNNDRTSDRKNVNMKGEEYSPNPFEGQERKTGSLWKSNPEITKKRIEYKEKAIADFEAKTETQDYETVGDKAVSWITKTFFS